MTASIDQIVRAMQTIAPLHYAEPWDNTGLLFAPPEPSHSVGRVLLTIDLTDAVMAEAIRSKTDVIVAYHPPIFSAVKRIGDLKPAVVKAIERGIALYSPHTALDAVPGGVNDWLSDGLGAGSRQPLQPHMTLPDNEQYKIVVYVPVEHVNHLRDELAKVGAGGIGNYHHCSFNIEGIGTFWGSGAANPAYGRKGRLERVPEVRLEMIASIKMLPAIARVIAEVHPYEEPAWEVHKLEPHPPTGTKQAGAGQGRIVTLDKPASLNTLTGRIKKHLHLKHVRVAAADKKMIRTIALCAGAGGSVLEGIEADLYFTGEMRHHDILDATARGTSVIVCDHTNTERGYLPTLRQRLAKLLGRSATITIARADHEPLRVV